MAPPNTSSIQLHPIGDWGRFLRSWALILVSVKFEFWICVPLFTVILFLIVIVSRSRVFPLSGLRRPRRLAGSLPARIAG